MRNVSAFFARDRARHPPAATPAYRSTTWRAPRHPLLSLEQTVSEMTGPAFGHGILQPLDNDLIHNFSHDGDAIGQRLVVYGQVLDENARPVPDALVEVWQANAGGRYRHKREGYLAALDPNFGGCGRVITDSEGRYSFRTVKPGAYPWPNGGNDWRPAHIHFSIFGQAFAQRLITQMYFEGDPMIWQCPIAMSIPNRAAVDQLIARLDRENSTPMDALAYRFDIVLRGRRSTMFENRPEGVMHDQPPRLKETPSQTAGPYVHIGLTPSIEGISGSNVRDLGSDVGLAGGKRILVLGHILDGSGAAVTDAIVELWQADANGTYDTKASSGWGRAAVDGSGAYAFDTIKPGPVVEPDGRPMAPHLTLWIVARGINIGLHTRLYFSDEAEANAADPLLNRISDPRRRQTLVAERSEIDGNTTYSLDIHLQGDDETVFFDI